MASSPLTVIKDNKPSEKGQVMWMYNTVERSLKSLEEFKCGKEKKNAEGV